MSNEFRLITSNQEEHEIKYKNNYVFCKTGFSFLLTHKGFRPGKLHTFIAKSGGGKSTLMKSLLYDYYEHKNSDQIPAVWFTEENREDFINEISSHGLFQSIKYKGDVNFFSELDFKGNDHELIQQLEAIFKQSSIVFFDNITTSRFYGNLDNYAQSKFSMLLKSLARQYEIPLVVFAHTGAHVDLNYTRLIEPEDIRGDRTIVNLSEFFYCMQQFHTQDLKVSSIRLRKHRGHIIEEALYFLNFNPLSMTYDKSNQVDFDKFKKAYKERQKL